MKFDELQMGQRFEWNGVTYVKAGPVVAREESTGKSRMIPRYAVLKPVGEVAAASKKTAPKMLSTDAVMAAFDPFYAVCVELIAQAHDSDAKASLESARKRFLDALYSA